MAVLNTAPWLLAQNVPISLLPGIVGDFHLPGVAPLGSAQKLLTRDLSGAQDLRWSGDVKIVFT
jgi:hypothetical protein